MKIFPIVLSLGVGAGFFVASSHSAFAEAADDPMSQAARDLYAQGAAAAEAKEWEPCRARMLAAWAIKKHAQIAAQLGECELNAGHMRDAAEHLQAFLDMAPPTTDPALRRRAEGLLAQAKTTVAVTTLSLPVPGTEVFLDGKSIGNATTVYLDPGHHAFEGRSEGRDTARVSVDVAAGSSQAITLTPATASKANTKSLPLLVAGGTVGVAGLAVGAIGLALSSGKHSDAVALSGSIRAGGGHCGASPTPGFEGSCGSLQDLGSSRDSTHALGVGGLIAGGLVTGLTLAYLLWPDTKHEAKTGGSFVIAPAFGEIGGVVARGTF